MPTSSDTRIPVEYMSSNMALSLISRGSVRLGAASSTETSDSLRADGNLLAFFWALIPEIGLESITPSLDRYLKYAFMAHSFLATDALERCLF